MGRRLGLDGVRHLIRFCVARTRGSRNGKGRLAEHSAHVPGLIQGIFFSDAEARVTVACRGKVFPGQWK